jgi:hypothetical protein
MGMSYRRYLSGERIYGCSTCKTHLATIHTMMSRVSLLYHDVPTFTSQQHETDPAGVTTGIQRSAWESLSL